MAGANPSFFCCRSAVTTRPRGRSGASQVLFSNLVLLPLEDQYIRGMEASCEDGPTNGCEIVLGFFFLSRFGNFFWISWLVPFA